MKHTLIAGLVFLLTGSVANATLVNWTSTALSNDPEVGSSLEAGWRVAMYQDVNEDNGGNPSWYNELRIDGSGVVTSAGVTSDDLFLGYTTTLEFFTTWTQAKTVTSVDIADNIDVYTVIFDQSTMGAATLFVVADATPFNVGIHNPAEDYNLVSSIAGEFQAITGLPPVNNPPTFTADPIDLSDAMEASAYNGTLAGTATDADLDTLSYSKVSGPAWLNVATNGVLNGTPALSDAGPNSWSVQVDDGNGGTDTATLNITVLTILPKDDTALSEATTYGAVSGTLADSHSNDDLYEAITEELDGTPTSLLEHEWTFNVYGAELVTFYVEAHHSANAEGDDFVFAYSTNGSSWTDMVTVTKTADDDTVQWYALPSGLNGTVYVRVLDTDRSVNNNGLDSLSVDAMFIYSENSTAAPSVATAPAPAHGAVDIPINQVLSWTAGAMAVSHDVYFGTNPTPVFQITQSNTTFNPGTLAYSTLYYWAVDEANNSGTTAGSTWSFTTADPANTAPQFTTDPVVEINATENSAYSSTLSDDATDVDLDTLTFSKVSGPAWLAVAFNGALSGTPASADVGLNSFSVHVDDGNGGTDTASLEITVDPESSFVDDFANGETLISGTVAGSYLDTQASDNSYEALTEVESGGKPSDRHSLLEHKWTVNVAGGSSVGFHVEAYHSPNSEGDDFVFSYSTDDGSYINMLTVSKTSDDNSVQSFALPASISGTVYIRVVDADSSQGNNGLDALYVDQMYIRSESGGGENNAPTFNSDPVVEINATENAAYSATLADDASDPESDPLTFSKVSGPAWLSVAADGSLSGTPGAGDVGANAFTVQVDATGGSDTATLDITVDAASSTPLPGQASDPSPLSGARNIATTVTLSWTAGSDAVSHDVYFGTASGSPSFMGNQTGTTFSPDTLGNKIKYYWRIDEVNATGTTTGTQWSFTTIR